MIASKRHGFIFMKTRKTAGTSVEIALSRVCGDDDVITPISPADEELRVAAGGRSPQNFTSPPLNEKVFNHVRARRARRALGVEWWRGSYRFAIERNPWDTAVSAYHWSFRPERVAAPPAFDDFVASDQLEKLARNSEIYRINGRLAVDRVLRYENLAAELGEVWAHLGLPGTPDLPHAKSGARPAGSYRDYYSPAARERVATVFADTIEHLGYEF